MKQGMSSDDSGWTLNYKTSTNSLGALNRWLGASHDRDIRLALHRAGTMWHLRGQPWESGSLMLGWKSCEKSSKCTQMWGKKRKWNIVKHSDANLLPTKCSLRWSQRVMYPSSLWMLSRAVHLLRSLTWHLPHANASDEDNCWIDSAYRTTCNLQKQPIKWVLLWGWFQIMEKNLSFLLDASCSRYDSQKHPKTYTQNLPNVNPMRKKFLKKRVKIHWMCFLLAEFCCGKECNSPSPPQISAGTTNFSQLKATPPEFSS